MNFNLMRILDYWAGILLCYFSSGMNYIFKLFSQRKCAQITPEKILFIKLSEMGSIILAQPLIEKTRCKYPRAKIFFLTFEKNRPLFEFLTTIPLHSVMTIRDDSFSVFVLDTIKVIKRLSREKIDVVFDLEFFSRFTALLSFASGAPKKIGFYRYSFEGLYRGNLFSHNICYNPLQHISMNYLVMFQGSKEGRKITPSVDEPINKEEIYLPIFHTSEESKNKIRFRLKRLGMAIDNELVLINAGGGVLSLREWPLENFTILAKQILQNNKTFIILVGTREEKEVKFERIKGL